MVDGDTVQAEIEAAAAAREEQESLRRRLEEANRLVAGFGQQAEQLRGKLADESADVAKLESFSPTKIWATLKGSHATDLDRETAERDAARYAVAEMEARLAATERDRDSLRARLDELGDVDARVAAALAAKEEWLSATDPVVGGQIANVAARRGALAARDRENREAFEAGQRAKHLLAEARSLLGSAQSWATWDTFGGGGLLTDMAKYDKLDKAAEVVHRANLALATFSRELADVGLPSVPGVEMQAGGRTFDIFFDNIFSDMNVRAQIQQTSDRIEHAGAVVEQALAAVDQTAREIAEQLRALESERERLLS